MITLAIFLPVLLSLCLGVVIFISYLRVREEILADCQKSVWSLQTQMAEKLNYLFSKNPAAKRLTLQMSRAQKILAQATATQNYPLIAQSTSQISLISIRQMALAREQTQVISSSATLAKTFSLNSNAHSSALGNKNWNIRISRRARPLLVVPSLPPNLMAPPLSVAPLFSTLQNATATYQAENVLPANLIKYFGKVWGLNPQSFNIKVSCSATLNQRSLKWSPQLSADKSLLKL